MGSALSRSLLFLLRGEREWGEREKREGEKMWLLGFGKGVFISFGGGGFCGLCMMVFWVAVAWGVELVERKERRGKLLMTKGLRGGKGGSGERTYARGKRNENFSAWSVWI